MNRIKCFSLVFVFCGFFLMTAAISSAKPGKKLGVPSLTPLQVITEIQNRFNLRNIRTMTYDETRVTSYEVLSGRGQGMMSMSPSNATTIRLRYFYQAPAKHGYRFLSEMPENYWAGSPNQPGAVPMDEKWKVKILSLYNAFLANRNEQCRERECYVLILVPRKGAPKELYPMTWYVDTKDLLVFKFIFLISAADGKFVRSTGDVYYKKANGFYMPERSRWRTKVSNLPFMFLLNTTMDNYHFNLPLDKSDFEEEFPKDWFKKLGEPSPAGK
jgi:hypothetical protein